MQTFLPYEDFDRSAASLDNKRLGKQRVEALQILNTLLGLSTGWSNHPAVKMWRGHEDWLLKYAKAICIEWMRRGFRDTVIWKLRKLPITLDVSEKPWWLGREELHSSHRSMLLRKKPEHYSKFGWKMETLGYWWPNYNYVGNL